MKILPILFFSIILFGSCKKDVDTRIYSVWYINGEQFRSANMSYVPVYWEVMELKCIDSGKTSFWFILPGTQFGDSRLSSNPALAPSTCGFLYKGKSYVAPYDSWIGFHWVSSSPNIQLAMDEGWFYNYASGTRIKLDSIRVSGGFSGPEGVE